jgi:hypothetical protein
MGVYLKYPAAPQLKTGKTMNRAMLAVLTSAAACLALAACGARSNPGSKPTVTVTAQAAPALTVTVTAAPKATPPKPRPPKPAAGPKVIARFNGSGTGSTPPFTTPASWHLSWEYNCSSFGSSGNFAVTEINADGSTDFNGVNVNELGSGQGPVAAYVYGDAGRHALQIDSECNWSVAVVTG